MKTLKISLFILLFLILTILSQIGGFVLILWFFVFRLFKHKILNKKLQIASSITGFLLFYLIFNFFIIPFLALKLNNRVPLSISKSGNLVPVTYWTGLLNRNYLTIKGKEDLLKIADEFAQKNPGLKLKYMDCNHPFSIDIDISKNFIFKDGIKIFPVFEGLFPHFSHSGDKVDLAFVYNDENGIPSNLTPTSIGYGSSVEPLPGETGYVDAKCNCILKTQNQINGIDGTPCKCDKENSFYSFMHHYLSKKEGVVLNNKLTKELIQIFIKHRYKGIILEAHLRERLHILSRSYGNHTCKTVRHDDHFHIQVPD